MFDLGEGVVATTFIENKYKFAEDKIYGPVLFTSSYSKWKDKTQMCRLVVHGMLFFIK